MSERKIDASDINLPAEGESITWERARLLDSLVSGITWEVFQGGMKWISAPYPPAGHAIREFGRLCQWRVAGYAPSDVAEKEPRSTPLLPVNVFAKVLTLDGNSAFAESHGGQTLAYPVGKTVTGGRYGVFVSGGSSLWAGQIGKDRRYSGYMIALFECGDLSDEAPYSMGVYGRKWARRLTPEEARVVYPQLDLAKLGEIAIAKDNGTVLDWEEKEEPLVTQGYWCIKDYPGLTLRHTNCQLFSGVHFVRMGTKGPECITADKWTAIPTDVFARSNWREATPEEVATLPNLTLEQEKQYGFYPDSMPFGCGCVAERRIRTGDFVTAEQRVYTGDFVEGAPKLWTEEELDTLEKQSAAYQGSTLIGGLIHTIRTRGYEARHWRNQRDVYESAWKELTVKIADTRRALDKVKGDLE